MTTIILVLLIGIMYFTVIPTGPRIIFLLIFQNIKIFYACFAWFSALYEGFLYNCCVWALEITPSIFEMLHLVIFSSRPKPICCRILLCTKISSYPLDVYSRPSMAMFLFENDLEFSRSRWMSNLLNAHGAGAYPIIRAPGTCLYYGNERISQACHIDGISSESVAHWCTVTILVRWRQLRDCSLLTVSARCTLRWRTASRS